MVIAALVGPATRSECVKKGKSMPPESTPRIQELRDYIQYWIDNNHSSWTRLFAEAGISGATQSKISNLGYLYAPTAPTLAKLATAMDIDPTILYVKAGLVPGDYETITRIHSEYDLDSDEKALIDNVRALSERQRRIVMNTARGLAEDGDGG